MAPSTKKTTEANSPARRIMTRSIYKKQQQKLKIESLEDVSSTTTTTATTATTMEDCVKSLSSSKEICSTPKGEKHMIPKISTCPPAPKKKKRLILNNCSSSNSTSSSAAKFFAHSDLELFFLFAPRNIHA